MHPFYGPSQRLLAARPGQAEHAERAEGMASMVAYLAFWAVVVVVAKRELDQRWPREAVRSAPGDPVDRAVETLRVRYARGEIDRDTFQAMRADLAPGAGADRRP